MIELKVGDVLECRRDSKFNNHETCRILFVENGFISIIWFSQRYKNAPFCRLKEKEWRSLIKRSWSSIRLNGVEVYKDI